MNTKTDLAKLRNEIEDAVSIRDALFVLKLNLSSLNRCDLAYEYMMKDTSFVRGDLVNMTTLSRKYTDLYLPSGGPNTDPVLENVNAQSQPFHVDLEKLCYGKQTKFSGNKFYMALLENGCTHFAAYPFKDDAGIGFGVFTIFATDAQMSTEYSSKYFQSLAHDFHNILKSNGQLASHFNLHERERFVLARMADGRTAADIAHELDITVRSIEMRLQSARKKLQARTTTEAVYKAVAYSILP